MTASRLERALRAYDGKHVDVLEELRDELPPTAATLRRAVRLVRHDDARIAQGASWLLLAWLDRGARATPKVAAELVALLPDLEDKWVLQHVARCAPHLPLDDAGVDAFAAMLDRCREHSLPFLRAWAVDSLHRLALRHARLEERARRALEQAQDDPAASVRARVRNIQRGR